MTNAFFVINFIVSFFSDIILNVLSRLKKSPAIIQSLKPYFEKNNFIITAIYAGLTILCALFVNSLITYYVFDFYYPVTNRQLLNYLIIAMPLGYLFDVIIYKCKIFGNLLDPYYKLAGPGLWGMVAYIFSILTSFLLFTTFHFKN
jgi:hypothetical protein